MSKTYTFEYKKKLKDRIEKLTDKKTLEKIRDIIIFLYLYLIFKYEDERTYAIKALLEDKLKEDN